jgi:hypothetical protein
MYCFKFNCKTSAPYFGLKPKVMHNQMVELTHPQHFTLQSAHCWPCYNERWSAYCDLISFNQGFTLYSLTFPRPECRNSQGRNCLSVGGTCELCFKVLIRNEIWSSSEPNTQLLQNQSSEGMLTQGMMTKVLNTPIWSVASQRYVFFSGPTSSQKNHY